MWICSINILTELHIPINGILFDLYYRSCNTVIFFVSINSPINKKMSPLMGFSVMVSPHSSRFVCLVNFSRSIFKNFTYRLLNTKEVSLLDGWIKIHWCCVLIRMHTSQPHGIFQKYVRVVIMKYLKFNIKAKCGYYRIL